MKNKKLVAALALGLILVLGGIFLFSRNSQADNTSSSSQPGQSKSTCTGACPLRRHSAEKSTPSAGTAASRTHASARFDGGGDLRRCGRG